MAYQVIARKWRPQALDQVVGQDHITKTLKNAIHSHRLPQALLFTGVRGTGKTSTARILAKTLRCVEPVEGSPCQECRECVDIAASRSVDVVEIDGASHNGVDAIRQLRETVAYMPSRGQYKFYIIDEVHMLSGSAFNALLKTLEEPPPHVIFILATTELQKIPATILSRCQRFDFRRIGTREIVAQMEKICRKEGYLFDDSGLWAIARSAQGSMRDAQSLLDQMVNFVEEKITQTAVSQVLGLADREIILGAVIQCIKSDLEGMYGTLGVLQESGIDPQVFLEELMVEFRHAVILKTFGPKGREIVDLPEGERTALEKALQGVGAARVRSFFENTHRALSESARSHAPRLYVEVVLLKLVALNAYETYEKVPWVESSQSQQAKAPLESAKGNPETPQKEVKREDLPFVRRLAGASTASSKVDQASQESVRNNSSHPMTKKEEKILSPPSVEEKDYKWSSFVSQVKHANGFLGALLENTELLERTSEELKIKVPAELGFISDKLKEQSNVNRVQTFVKTFWNEKLRVEVVSGKSEKISPKILAEKKKIFDDQSLKEKIRKKPFVQDVERLFGAKITKIEDLPKE